MAGRLTSKLPAIALTGTIPLGEQVEDAPPHRVGDGREQLRTRIGRHADTIGKDCLTSQPGDGG